jgi:hypothetical protein
MPKLHDRWTVLPHGPLRAIDDRLLTVAGQIPMPLGGFPRRMTIAALPRKRTAIFSPIPLDEESMARIEAFGRPAFLVIPNGKHRLDARPFKARYPKARVLTAPAARAAVEEAVKVDQADPALSEAVRLVMVAGTAERELAMIVDGPSGTSLVTNDIIGHVRHPQGPGAWLIVRLMAFGLRRPEVPRPIRKMLVDDSAALAAQLREWAALPNLRRIIPSHGEIIEQPAAELARLAQSLGKAG